VILGIILRDLLIDILRDPARASPTPDRYHKPISARDGVGVFPVMGRVTEKHNMSKRFARVVAT
jgi:hypothetical protein